VKPKFHVLVDSDAFVGWYLPADAHFRLVTALFTQLDEENRSLVTTSWVVAETATVLSHRVGQENARQFLDMVINTPFPVIHITEELQAETIKVFLEQKTKNTSMVDCANVVVMRRFDIPSILSFDKFYHKRFNLPMVA
jgi:predicted nucleic acid-binding protein